jgi:hypothetical protein
MDESELLSAALARCEAIEASVLEQMPDEVSGASLPYLVAKTASVFIQHHRSIRLLVTVGDRDASAIALFRPHLEFGYKALWLKFIAQPDRLRRIVEGGAVFPVLTMQLAQRIARKSGCDAYSLRMRDKEVCHDLAISGRESVGRRYKTKSSVRTERDAAAMRILVDRMTIFTQLVFFDVLDILRD